MLEFKEIQLEDKEWIDSLLKLSDFRGCEYTFVNNYVWRKIFNITICRYKDFYICKQGDEFIFPAGKGDIDDLICTMKDYCKLQNIPLKFCSVDKATTEMLKEKYNDNIKVSTNEDLYDYVYNVSDLSTLAGKKLHSKRNHINRFKENNWSFEEITPENLQECWDMNEQWCKINDCIVSEEKNEEACAVRCGLKNFFALGLVGGILRVDGKIQAFSYGEPLNSDTFNVHVEKALTDFQGTYPMINYAFVNHFCMDFKYVNREEDMGEENLRKAKRSYKPVFLEEKYAVEFI